MHNLKQQHERQELQMSDIECKVNEASPLIAEEEEQPSTSSFFSTPVKVAVAVGATLALGAVAFLSYDKGSVMPATTSLAINKVFDNIDFAMCPNHYVMGLTPRAANDGCAIISNQDLFDKDADKIVAYTVTVCMNGPKNLEINYDTLAAMGFTPNKNGDLGISSLSLGRGVSGILYTGKDLDGASKMISSGPTSLPSTKFPSLDRKKTGNDEVNSISLTSKTGGDVWAGRGCGITFNVCPAVVSSAVVRGPVEDGCVIVSVNDPTAPQYFETEVKAVRFCSAHEHGKVTITRDQLQVLELVEAWDHRKSHISYMNKGASITTVFYEGPDANTRISGINTGSGSFVHMYYHNDHPVNDNVYSIDVNGGDPKIPNGCDFTVLQDDDPMRDHLS
jgi:hypothetical protein